MKEKRIHRITTLWMFLIIGMMLHSNYHLSKLFYGINIVRPGSNGTVPITAHLIKNIYYHIPIISLMIFLYFHSYWVRFVLFAVSLTFNISHTLHLIGEFRKPDPDASQIPLLSIVLVVSTTLTVEHWKYFMELKKKKKTQNENV
ncbi:MAG: hypothetical protein NZ529_02855 [Cytophagaceae bacterium]|nr:hypothetical protein [Cytophagaceae bacterium]MDW8455711.1 hypothetical protein [Cytophagaceae bacterium]